MANKVPRVRIGTKDGSWICKFVDTLLSPKDVRLIHRAIDVEAGAVRRRRKQDKITKQIRKQQVAQAARDKDVRDEDTRINAAAAEAEELTSEAFVVEQAEDKQRTTVNEVMMTETEKENNV